ncbi:uncharacterized protein LY89DRAFT_676507 [Mollisia scopiformis]|uniref:Uncharacterized protein n=1 Tax=Mollisia scopiformis TaxID=149040 RepID=A0A132B9R5_MOLSC|nr:uncharacterized protein LY89DRAFT_676507 [Mollisia scopiformis]KUJ09145.1 hypothetical protein LY89DRAFT_676507 [Mollisia scopiformis]
MSPSETASLVLSAVSFAIQLYHLGDQISARFHSTSPDDAELRELSIAILDESDHSKVLSSILCDKGKFGLTDSIFESLDQNNKKILLAVLEQLSGVWTETNEFATAIFERAKIAKPQVTPSQLESGENNDLLPLRHRAEAERLKRQLEIATNLNRRLERRIQTFSWLYSVDGASPAQSIDRLDKIAKDSHAQRLGWSRPAELRQLVLGLRNPNIDRTSLPIPQALEIDGACISGLGTLRDGDLSGMMDRRKVLVEFLPSFQMSGDTSQEATKKGLKS